MAADDRPADPWDDIRVRGVVRDEATQAAGLPGGDVVLRLSRPASREWALHFIRGWERVAASEGLTGIRCGVSADRITLRGTTVRDVVDSHMTRVLALTRVANEAYRTSLNSDKS